MERIVALSVGISVGKTMGVRFYLAYGEAMAMFKRQFGLLILAARPSLVLLRT